MDREIQLRKQIQRISGKLDEYVAHNSLLDSLLKYAYYVTFLLLLAFTISLYLGDILHLRTFINSSVDSVFGLGFYIVVATLLALTLAKAKHAIYGHFSLTNNTNFYILSVVIIIAIFAELFTSTGNQDAKVRSINENSKEFNATLNSNPVASINTAISPAQLPPPPINQSTSHIESELAKAKSYLVTCKKTCNDQQAKINSLIAELNAVKSNNQSANNAYQAQLNKASELSDKTIKAQQEAIAAISLNAQESKNNRLDKLKLDAYNPVFKAVSWMLSVTIPASMVIIILIVSVCFEAVHFYLSEMKKRTLLAIGGLQDELSMVEIEYKNATGFEYKSPPALAPLDKSDADAVAKPFGFAPATITATHAVVYQSEPARFIGFIDPSKPISAQAKILAPKPAQSPITLCTGVSNPVHRGGTGESAQATTGVSTVYKEWLDAIHTGVITLSKEDCRAWVQKRIAGAGSQRQRKTPSRVEINRIVDVLFLRAVNDPNSQIEANKEFTCEIINGKPRTNGKPKYIYNGD